MVVGLLGKLGHPVHEGDRLGEVGELPLSLDRIGSGALPTV